MSASHSATRPLRAAVIGAGMSGILAGIKLSAAGITDFRIYEKALRLGGTWRENTYPGIACDVPSHHYCYSFELNPDWTQRFSPGPEILDYFERVAAKYAIEPHILYGQEVTAARFREGRWHLTTATGLEDTVDLVICATGFLHHPAVPDLPGLDTYAGAAFHSARWDHSVPLRGSRLGVIGTGSTALQIVPAVVGEVARVTQFQRTAQWVLPLPNATYSDAERAAYRAEPDLMRELYHGWLARFQSTISRAVIGDAAEMAKLEAGCRANLEQNVLDPALRAKLTPTYKVGCKRLIMSDIYYPAIQRPNAELVTAAIERVEPRGVRTVDGRLHELDILVLATGFDGHAYVRPLAVEGPGGRTLDEAWAGGNLTHRSMSVPGFPNFFLLVGPNSPVGNFSVIVIAELQLDYLCQLIAPLARGECATIAPRAESAAAFVADVHAAMGNTVWASGCRSWYLDRHGHPELWPWTFERFQDDMTRPRFEEYHLA